MEIALIILSAAALALAFWAGYATGKRRYRVPVSATGHTDEFLVLKDGAFVPYEPPQYVPEGMSPVAATWAKVRETGVQHHTRRVGE